LSTSERFSRWFSPCLVIVVDVLNICSIELTVFSVCIDTFLTHHWNIEQSERSNEEQGSTATQGNCRSTVNIEEEDLASDLSREKVHQTSVEVSKLGSIVVKQLFQLWRNETRRYYCSGIPRANESCF
jgi:hypothetical protein